MLATEDPEGTARSPRNRPLIAWLCLVSIPLLFELPAALTSTEIDPGAIRLSLDVPLLLTLWLASAGSARPVLARIALRVGAGLVVFYRLDQWVCWTLLRDEPLLYDQVFMLRHLWALIGDLMNLKTALALLGLALGGLVMGWLMRVLLRGASVLASHDVRRTRAILAAAWCIMLIGRAAQLGQEDPRIGWLAPKIASNVRRSARTYGSIQKRLHKSPYARYAKLALRDKPDVLLFIVESYGRLLSVEEKTADRHAALLRELERELRGGGFHAASGFATATVSGGRSWIAEGTMLMGTPIRYEAVFQHIVAQKPPSFVGFLNQNGYESALLAPADRHRAGFHPENRYGFARLFTYDQLGYTGTPIGWGLVPDQYSLAFIDKHFLRPARGPVFLDFHMVSSHAPWSEVPQLEQDPERLLATGSGGVQGELGAEDVSLAFRRYGRGNPRHAYMRRFDDSMREGYQSTIEYDLRAIVQFLMRRERDGFVIVLGDHQPPVIAREDKSFDAPVHVLSRNPARLAPLLEYGFVKGLTIGPDAPPAVHQAGLFSLWVHTLMAMHCDDCTLPEVRPNGDVVLAK